MRALAAAGALAASTLAAAGDPSARRLQGARRCGAEQEPWHCRHGLWLCQMLRIANNASHVFDAELHA